MILSVFMVLTLMPVQAKEAKAEETITTGAITYDTDKMVVSSKLSGRQVTKLLDSAVDYSAGEQARVDNNSQYTYLAKKNGSSYDNLYQSDDLLDPSGEYYLVFNVEDRDGYVFSTSNPPAVTATVNGVAADDVRWRGDPSPTGDINVYKRVTVTNDDWVFSINTEPTRAYVKKGNTYQFSSVVEGTN